mgnify:CR=1 FL=1
MSTTKFIPTLWSARILAALEKELVYSKFFNRDYEGEIQSAGDTVKIGLVGAPTVKAYSKGAAIDDPEDVSVTESSLAIDQADYFNIAVEDVDAAQSAINLLESATSQTGYGFSDKTDQYLGSLLAGKAGATIGTKAAPTAITAANAYNILVQLKTALDKANCPKTNRVVAVPPEFEGFMLLDPRFVQVGVDASDERLTEGTVYKAAGFQILVTNNAPQEEVTGEKEAKTLVFDIIAGCDQSGTYADQILKTEAYRPEKSFKDAVKGLHVYGAAVTRPTCVVSAKVSF